jgi:hypothetical protein
MDYRYLDSIFRGPLTGVTIGYYPTLGARAPLGRRGAEPRRAPPLGSTGEVLVRLVRLDGVDRLRGDRVGARLLHVLHLVQHLTLVLRRGNYL